MGGKQKKKESSKAKPDLFEKPMENPFLGPDLKKVPVKAENGKDLFDKPMENPFTFVDEKENSQASFVPRKVGAESIQMPPRKSREEVSSARGWTYAVKQPPKKKTS